MDATAVNTLSIIVRGSLIPYQLLAWERGYNFL